MVTALSEEHSSKACFPIPVTLYSVPSMFTAAGISSFPSGLVSYPITSTVLLLTSVMLYFRLSTVNVISFQLLNCFHSFAPL